MFNNVSTRICAALIAMAAAPAVAYGQPSGRPDPAAISMSAPENREVVLSLADILRERFAFRERGAAAAREIEALEQRGVFSDAATAAELLSLIDTHVKPLVDDRHFRVRYMGPEVTATFSDAPPSAEEIAAFHEEVRLRGGEIPEVRWLAGNVGYLRINRFLDAEPSLEKLAAAMGMLADTGALIIDVRGAPGGEPAGVAKVIGHLVSERTGTVQVEDPYDVSASRVYYAAPRSPGYAEKPVFVLIDGGTGSGAEEFAYDLQAMKRATLVGATTYGAATPGGYRPLAEGFAAFIPMQIVTNTISGRNWEGIGVSPDIEVPAEAALERAHRLALEAILETAEGIHRDLAEEGLASLKK